jgi:hypothetical protein
MKVRLAVVLLAVGLLLAGTSSAQDLGRLTVVINPPQAAKAGAAWSLDGGKTWLAGGQGLDLRPGPYQVRFKALTGWSAPEPFQVTVKPLVKAEATVTYLRQVKGGKLTVTLGPAKALAEGAAWSADHGATWLASGQTAQLPAGSHPILIKALPGWARPAPQEVSLHDGESIDLSYTYGESLNRPTGFLKVVILPEAAAQAGAKWSVDAGSNWYDSGQVARLEANTYRVQFNRIPGWVKPLDRQVRVEVDRQTTDQASYEAPKK